MRYGKILALRDCKRFSKRLLEADNGGLAIEPNSTAAEGVQLTSCCTTPSRRHEAVASQVDRFHSAAWRSPGDPWLCVPSSQMVCLYRGTRERPTEQRSWTHPLIGQEREITGQAGRGERKQVNPDLTLHRSKHGLQSACCQIQPAFLENWS